jgi:hypothetical protein
LDTAETIWTAGNASQTNSEELELAKLSIGDLRKDHDRIRDLLHRSEHSEAPSERRELMRLAVDLFQVHSALDRQLYQIGPMADAQYWIAEQARQLAGLETRCRRYRARSLELKQAIETYLATEEHIQPPLVRQQLCLDHDNRNLLLLRSLLIEKTRNPVRFH